MYEYMCACICISLPVLVYVHVCTYICVYIYDHVYLCMLKLRNNVVYVSILLFYMHIFTWYVSLYFLVNLFAILSVEEICVCMCICMYIQLYAYLCA